ncbi:glycine zipper 2TM domain-containing protein [Agrilutibacter solisilvae]|uniref:Glycine zipper 2TM domain-containing protein n=1 Tax=Agrilutibacter solisilvae TaxID=2763317 RepID=A0A974XYS9_9GAMM|nr:glycine zipper 2TM domain-containing protein [Lysobacter solisilvae]QSX78194.1 glycine zipper 2TM domain-containing protein [Lysobacter solisilvae]
MITRHSLPLLGVAAAACVALAGCTSSPTYSGNGYSSPSYGSSTATCYDCGTVTRIETVGTGTRSGATGAVIGGLVGAAAGRELAEDESKGRQNTATVAGAAAGAVAGAAIQRNVGNHPSYNVTVRLDDGRFVTVSQSDLGGIREGSYVRVANGRAWVR